jgi:protein TonB
MLQPGVSLIPSHGDLRRAHACCAMTHQDLAKRSLKGTLPGRKIGCLMLFCVLLFAATPPASAAMEPAVPVRMVAPEYPKGMRHEGISGIVTVTFHVDEKGDVVDPAIQKSTNPGFDDAALAAIVKWKFKPARQDGVPVRTKLSVPLQFKIED